MNAYWSLVSARFRTLLQYRSAALAGFGTQLFWGLIRVMIFEAFFASSTAAQPLDIDSVVTYIWLGQAFLVFLPWNPDVEIRQLIRTGAVSYELLRPMDLYSAWFARAIALRSAPATLRMIPLVAVALLFFHMQPPASWAAAGAFAVAMIGALMLSCAFTSLMNISLLWTISGEGISGLIPPVVFILSGMIVPLPLFPDGAQTILRALPFSGIVDTPFRLYIGDLPASQLPARFAHQLGWTIALVVLGRWLLSRGVRRLVVQGG